MSRTAPDRLGISGPAVAVWMRTISKAASRSPRPDLVWDPRWRVSMPATRGACTRNCSGLSEPDARAADKVVEHRMHYSNFKKAGDLNLPHTFQRSVDGKASSETTFKQIRINPKIDSKKFAISKTTVDENDGDKSGIKKKQQEARR